MCQFPEKIGGVGVCVTGCCSPYAGVEADEHADQIGSEGVGQMVGYVGVL